LVLEIQRLSDSCGRVRWDQPSREEYVAFYEQARELATIVTEHFGLPEPPSQVVGSLLVLRNWTTDWDSVVRQVEVVERATVEFQRKRAEMAADATPEEVLALFERTTIVRRGGSPATWSPWSGGHHARSLVTGLARLFNPISAAPDRTGRLRFTEWQPAPPSQRPQVPLSDGGGSGSGNRPLTDDDRVVISGLMQELKQIAKVASELSPSTTDPMRLNSLLARIRELAPRVFIACAKPLPEQLLVHLQDAESWQAFVTEARSRRKQPTDTTRLALLPSTTGDADPPQRKDGRSSTLFGTPVTLDGLQLALFQMLRARSLD
jgi:hypothetical protein